MLNPVSDTSVVVVLADAAVLGLVARMAADGDCRKPGVGQILAQRMASMCPVPQNLFLGDLPDVLRGPGHSRKELELNSECHLTIMLLS